MNNQTNALAIHGKALQAKGYEPIPIKHKQKAPLIKGWRDESYVCDIDKSLSNGYGGDYCNVGIPARGLVVVDVDCYDKDLSGLLLRQTIKLLGDTPVRIGQSPKFMLFYRLEDGIVLLSKFSTPKFSRDDDGKQTTAQIEVLGSGQQFLAYGTHPNGRKMRWAQMQDNGKLQRCDGLISIERDDLTVIAPDSIIELQEKFMELAQEAGMTPVSRGSSRLKTEKGDVLWSREHGDISLPTTSKSFFDEIDAAMSVQDLTPKPDITIEEARKYLAAIPNDGKADQEQIQYDDWFSIVCGVHHQFGGSEDALDLALEFSRRNPVHNEDFFLERVWPYIDSERDGGNTFATVIHYAKPYLPDGTGPQNKDIWADYFHDATVNQDLISKPLKPRKFLIQDIFPEGIVAILSAAGGVGKSYLALQMTVAVASGGDLFSNKVNRQGQVLYLTAEDDRPEAERRLQKCIAHAASNAEKEYGHEAAKAIYDSVQNIHIKYIGGDNPSLTTKERGKQASLSDYGVKLSEAIEDAYGTNLALLIIDTYSRTNAGDENDNGDAKAYITAVEMLKPNARCCTLILAHTRKGSDNAHIDDDATGGAKRLTDNARANFLLSHYLPEKKAESLGINRRKYLMLTFGKNNYGPASGERVYLERLYDDRTALLPQGDIIGLGGVLEKSVKLESKATEIGLDAIDKALVKSIQKLQNDGKPLTKTFLDRNAKKLTGGKSAGVGRDKAVQSLHKLIEKGEVITVKKGRAERYLITDKNDFDSDENRDYLA
ncbi:AAA family ATPase [Ningiella sp. W23]|uniref:AAA family ATPase n=1 Tax=Ningiella sp. W23 TaxID=3023715 RepID=UPI003756EF92